MLDFLLKDIAIPVVIAVALVFWRLIETREEVRRDEREQERSKLLVKAIQDCRDKVVSQIVESSEELKSRIRNSTSGDVTWHVEHFQETLDSIAQSASKLQISVEQIRVNLPTS